MDRLQIALVAGLALTSVHAFANPYDYPQEFRVAQKFLYVIDQEGDVVGGYEMLDPLARQNYPLQAFSQVVKSRRERNGRMTSTIIYGALLSKSSAVGKQQFLSPREGRFTVMCFRDEPQSGWGSLSYTEVLVITRQGREPAIANITFNSELSANCGG